MDKYRSKYTNTFKIHRFQYLKEQRLYNISTELKFI